MSNSDIKFNKRRYKQLKKKFDNNPQEMKLEELAEYYLYEERMYKK